MDSSRAFSTNLTSGRSPTDTNSNHGEIFYSVVPDPAGSVSCAHSVTNLGLTVPATFMHELQHLISFSQHFVVHGGNPEFGWLDEGLSIVAEELGSVFYEQKCPGTACRTNPTQIFPDSSQGFVQDFLFDSYVYGLRPDTASVTLHSDSDGGFSGGAAIGCSCGGSATRCPPVSTANWTRTSRRAWRT